MLTVLVGGASALAASGPPMSWRCPSRARR